MSLGLAATLVGFGDQNDERYQVACQKVGEVVKKNTSYLLLSFVPLDVPINTLVLKMGGDGIAAAERMVDLPSISELQVSWRTILQELSADLEDTIISIFVHEVTEAALNGNIL